MDELVLGALVLVYIFEVVFIVYLFRNEHRVNKVFENLVFL